MIEKFEEYINKNNENVTLSNEDEDDEEIGLNTPFQSFKTNGFDNDNDNDNDNRYDVSQKHHIEWVKQYPFLKQLHLETEYVHANKEHIWFYNLNKKQDKLQFSIFIEIRKATTWTISLEIDTTAEDNFETSNKTLLEDSHSYEKKGLTYDQLLSNMREVSKHLKKWNANIEEVSDHSALDFE